MIQNTVVTCQGYTLMLMLYDVYICYFHKTLGHNSNAILGYDVLYKLCYTYFILYILHIIPTIVLSLIGPKPNGIDCIDYREWNFCDTL